MPDRSAAVVLLLALSAPVCAEEAKPAAALPRVTTIHEEQISAAPLRIAEGNLLLASEPARQIPLDELSSIDFGNAAVLVARWLGQDNHDLAQAKTSEGASGIQDLHIQLSGLIRNRPIKQIVLSQGFLIWKSDASKGTNWKLVVEHTSGSGTAELYAEPPKPDSKDRVFKVTVTYDEGSPASAEIKAATATDNALKVVANEGKAPVPTAAGPAAVVVHLEDGGELSGQLEALAKESLRLKAATEASIDIPLLRVRGLWFESAGAGKAQASFAERLKAPTAEDAAFVRAQDQSVAEIAGEAQEISEQKLKFNYQGDTRAINVARLVGLVFAAHPPLPATDRPYQVFKLAGGDRVSGTWTGLADGVLDLQLPWDTHLWLPVAAVSGIEFRNGKLAYLSDIEPASVEEVAYFDRALAYRRDRSLVGDPLKLKGTEYRKGLAVHSRTVLTYTIDRKYAKFKAIVGFDDTVAKRGRVACRVLGDGRELFAEHDLRADQEPKPLEIDVAGVNQLALEIDFGEDENICDRVIWAGARLYRE
jgi:NPCBM/NEW2 domain